jgi:hypothetical protein
MPSEIMLGDWSIFTRLDLVCIHLGSIIGPCEHGRFAA